MSTNTSYSAEQYSTGYNAYLPENTSSSWNEHQEPNSYSSWGSSASFTHPSPSSSPYNHQQEEYQSAVETSSQYASHSSYHDTNYRSAPSSASSDSSLSPHMVLTPTHDGYVELPRLEAQPPLEHAAVHGLNTHDMQSSCYAHSPDWCADGLEPHTSYGMAPTLTRAWFSEEHTAINDKTRTQRFHPPNQGYEMAPHNPMSSHSVLFSQQQYRHSQQQQQQHQQQQRPQLYPLQIPCNTQYNHSITHHHPQHQIFASNHPSTAVASTSLSNALSPPKVSPTPRIQPPIKLHHPRPSRRIPIISLSELASASADALVSPSAHATTEVSPISPPRQTAYRSYDAPAKPDDLHSRRPAPQLTTSSWSPIGDYYSDQISCEPTQRDGFLLCSCGCMESYTIPE
ncbi:hypothetical protein BDN72DRAFT_873774 [Pluteus cervinus]|uniref:Uncharacterized protein n=1 Tax=Pluteus cervinus TaxID=181527 RepID=A0ACD3BHA1_9AGAR|nr:hypothetical protein BDN72DRAFT_873774 [Pluteus cervinus]